VQAPAAIVEALLGFSGRGPCTDAERRAAGWLHDELRRSGHSAWVETHWVRPQWPGSLLLACALGIAGALASTRVPVAGAVLAAVAALSLAMDAAGRPGVLRGVFARRATQNVLVVAPDPERVAVLVCARYDAPRRGLLFAEPLRRLAARAGPDPRAWLALAAAVVALGAGLRAADVGGTGVGVLQFTGAVLLVLGVAAACDFMLSAHAPGANDNASGTAAALAVFDELSRRPLQRLSPGLLLVGAGEDAPLGLRAQLGADRPRPADTVLVELGPCGAGTAHWRSTQDQLVAAASGVAPRIRGRRGAGVLRGIPTVWIGGLAGGIAPRARQGDDTGVDPDAIAAAAGVAIAVVVALDAALAASDAQPAQA
jgi:hypothetical protein